MKEKEKTEKHEAICYCSHCKCNRAFVFDSIAANGVEKHRCVACGHLYAVTGEGNAPRSDLVTLAKGGTGERTVKISSLEIPSLWHIANAQKNPDARQAILDVWHIAHDLKRELLERDQKLDTSLAGWRKSAQGARAFELDELT